jgi:nitrate/nitrite transporter NarK
MTANSLLAFLFWGFFLGLAGSSFAVGAPYVSRWFGPEKQGLVAGIFGMGNIGTAVAARVAPPVAAARGWQLVPQYFSKEAGTVTGLVGAAGGPSGFFPPIVMGFFKSTLGSYTIGYGLLAAVEVACLVLLVLQRPVAAAKVSHAHA